MEPAAASMLLIVGLVSVVGILVVLLVQSNKKLINQRMVTKNVEDMRDAFIDVGETVIYLKDDDLNYLFINKAAEPHYHKSVQDIIGHDDSSLEVEPFGPAMIETDRQVIEHNEIIAYEEKHKNRSYKMKNFRSN